MLMKCRFGFETFLRSTDYFSKVNFFTESHFLYNNKLNKRIKHDQTYRVADRNEDLKSFTIHVKEWKFGRHEAIRGKRMKDAVALWGM